MYWWTAGKEIHTYRCAINTCRALSMEERSAHGFSVKRWSGGSTQSCRKEKRLKPTANNLLLHITPTLIPSIRSSHTWLFTKFIADEQDKWGFWGSMTPKKIMTVSCLWKKNVSLKSCKSCIWIKQKSSSALTSCPMCLREDLRISSCILWITNSK